MIIAILAKMNGNPVDDIVDTGSAGVVISESFFERLGLKGDNDVKYGPSPPPRIPIKTQKNSYWG